MVFAGSGTCRPLIEVLIEGFKRRNPDVNVEFLPVTHSSGGISAAASGTADIGMVSRELKPEERELGLKYVVLSEDGLCVAVDPRLGVKRLTIAQVRRIYAGTLSDWSQAGGPKQPIIVLDRNEDESAKIIFRQYVIGQTRVTPQAVNLFYEDETADAVQKTSGAIGYLSVGFAKVTSVTAELVALDGVKPTVENILAGRYKVVRPLGVVYDEDISGTPRRFLEYAVSAAARSYMAKRGFAPPGR